MRRVLMAALLWAMPIGAQTAKDTARVASVRTWTDSIRAVATNPRVRAFATRVDSIEGQSLVKPTPPSPPPVAGFAELPRDTVPLPTPPNAGACNRTVSPPMALQTAVNLLVAGDVLCVASANWGTLVLPNRNDGPLSSVTIRPLANDSLFALPGERIRPSRATGLPRLTGANRVLSVAPGATGWRLIGFQVDAKATATQPLYWIAELGDAGVTGPATQVSHVTLERSYVHPVDSLAALMRCVSANGAWVAVIDSWLENCRSDQQDAQAISVISGTGPYRFTNNALIASGENILIGGGDPKWPLLIPGDITITRNDFYTPATATWRCIVSKKNLFELKNAQRVLVRRNVLHGSYLCGSKGQNGEAVVVKSANQSGGCRWCVSRHVTVEQNLIQDVGAGFYLIGIDGTNFPGDSLTNHVVVQDNWVENINTTPLYTGSGRAFALTVNVQDVLVRRNTFTGTGAWNSYLSPLFSSNNAAAASRFTWEDNVSRPGQYGVIGCQTVVAWSCIQGATWGRTVLVGTPGGGAYPPGVGFVPTLTAALATGAGVAWSTIQAATAGVVVAR